MARFNKIFLGPFEKVKPQVKELPAAAALKPGRLAVITAGEFALAGAATVGKVWLVQDNYLQMKTTDDDWETGDTAIGIELDDQCLYAARVANGVNITAVGTPLTPGANGTLAIAALSDLVVAYSDEAFNNNTGEEQLIRIRPAGSASYLSASA